MKRDRLILALIAVALCLVIAAMVGCVPPQGTPGYSLAGPSGNSTGYSRPIQQVEGGSGSNE